MKIFDRNTLNYQIKCIQKTKLNNIKLLIEAIKLNVDVDQLILNTVEKIMRLNFLLIFLRISMQSIIFY